MAYVAQIAGVPFGASMKIRSRRMVGGVRLALLCALIVTAIFGPARQAWSQTRQTLAIRGRQQSLYIYGSPQGAPVIVSSGDGGWVHLGPHVAELLAGHGFFV